MDNKLNINDKTSILDNDIKILNRKLDDNSYENCSPEQLELERKKREERRQVAKMMMNKSFSLDEKYIEKTNTKSTKTIKKELINFACGLSVICVIKYVYNELAIWHDWFNILLGIMTIACYIYLFSFYINVKEKNNDHK